MRDPLEAYDVDRRRAVLVVALLTAGAVALAVARPTVFGTILVIVSFFFMIVLHELGHFVMAKRAGMKVTEFFVGFGPRIWSIHRGETEYGIKALPLGGYCKIIGMTNLEDVAPADEPSAYRSKGYLARLGVAVAGSVVHFVIALVLMFLVVWGAGDYRNGELRSTLSGVEPGAPADAAGIEAGDTILEIDGVAIEEWQDVPDTVRPRDGETVDFVVERDGVELTLPVTLAETHPQVEGKAGYAGVSPTSYVPEPGALGSLKEAPLAVADLTKESVSALGRMFSLEGLRSYRDTLAGSDSGDGAGDDTGTERFVSPVGFGRLANQAVVAGWVSTFFLLISINVFVGIFNMVPLLPFDGGHVAIATYERVMSTIRRRRVQVDVAKLLPLTVAVVGILAFIFLSALFLDVSRPIPDPF